MNFCDSCVVSSLRAEVEAYCALVSAFRAQGELTWKKAQLLQDLRQVLRVPEERHKMELKRVSEDETLIELAKLSAGYSSSLDSPFCVPCFIC